LEEQLKMLAEGLRGLGALDDHVFIKSMKRTGEPNEIFARVCLRQAVE